MRGAWTRLGAIGQVLLAIAGMYVASALIGLVTPVLPENLRTPVLALGMWGGVLAGAVMLRLSKTSYREIGFVRPTSWRRTVICAAVALAAAEAGALGLGELIRQTTDWPPLDTAYIRTSIAGDPVAYVAWIVLVVWGSAAFAEELFARGFVMDRLQAAFGRGRAGLVLAVLLQAALFGVLHAVQGPTGIVITAYVGLVFAVAYFASGRNLWAPILAHGTADTISLTLLFLGVPLPGYAT